MKKVPERMCIGCHTARPKRDLIRIVRSPEGEFSIDLTGKSPGRGAYLCREAACLEAAYKGHKLEKTFKMKMDQKIYEELREIMERESR